MRRRERGPESAALITGADSGIGRAVAIAYAREGADVLISYLDEHEDAEETRRWVEEAGRRAVVVPGDVPRHQPERVLPPRQGGGAAHGAWGLDHRQLVGELRQPDAAAAGAEGDPGQQRRAGQPAEPAPVYVLLASDDGSYVSGARVAVTGGTPIL
ncbi:SDR family oxidoreductase [Streptomyces sp. MN03-5084-2B]|nr:SDR family oxidoreductase [Streptomyces sp. MN03-5084-2B]